MKSAKEWAEFAYGPSLATDKVVLQFIANIQRDAMETCARVIDGRIGKLMDEGSGREEIEWRDHEAAQCRDACRALLPKPPTTTETT